jgi:hypothetical protein
MEMKDLAWAIIQKTESAFSKDDIDSAPIEVLRSVLVDIYKEMNTAFCEVAPRAMLKEKIVGIYAEMCEIADESVDWWERDDDAIAEIRKRIIKDA